MLRPILSITDQTIKSYVRRGNYLALFVILIAGILIILFQTKADGTVEGKFQVAIYYVMGYSLIISLINTLCVSTVAISGEIKNKTLINVIVKTPHRFTVWLGKWIGISLISISFIMISSAIIYIVIKIKVDILPPDIKNNITERIFTGRYVIPVSAGDIKSEAEVIFKDLIKDKTTLSISEKKQLMELAYYNAAVKLATVHSGESKEWKLTEDLPCKTSAVWLKTIIHLPAFSSSRATLRWKIIKNNETIGLLEVKDIPEGTHEFKIPLKDSYNGRIRIVLENNSIPVYFTPDRPLTVLIPWKNFYFSLLLATGLIILVIVTITAIGLLFSTLFSTPIAMLALLLFIIGPPLTTVVNEEYSPSDYLIVSERTSIFEIIEKTSIKASLMLNRIFTPFKTGWILNSVAEGTVPMLTDAIKSSVFLSVASILSLIVSSFILDIKELDIPHYE